MFGGYSSSSSYASARATANNHITVNQQPHDAADAARLYGELQKEAESKIKDLICHQLGGLNAQFASFQADYMPYHMKDVYKVFWKLNGQNMSATVEVDELDKLNAENPRLAGLRKIAESITEVILDRLILEYHASQRFRR